MYSAGVAYHPELREVLLAMEEVVLVNQFGSELRIAARPELGRSELETTISRVSGEPCVLVATEPNLEDVFIAITQAVSARQ